MTTEEIKEAQSRKQKTSFVDIRAPALIHSIHYHYPQKNDGKERCKKACISASLILYGVTDGARTHDHRNHNPGLYQLSYSHHGVKLNKICRWRARQESNL